MKKLSSEAQSELRLIIGHFTHINKMSKIHSKTEKETNSFLRSEIKTLNQFVATETFKDLPKKFRDTIFKNISDLEHDLKRSVNSTIPSFDAWILKFCEPLAARERAVLISTILHDLNVYDQKPFLTLEQAENHSAENDRIGGGEDLIYNRLKKYLKK